MSARELEYSTQGHARRLLEDLVEQGWRIESIPADARIPRNGLKIVLNAEATTSGLRLFIYKVTESGRSKPHERRVEITTTYASGLNRAKGYADVVLGIDPLSKRYVGIDSRRLKMGGRTHNASSFFDREGLSVKDGDLLVNPRAVNSNVFPDKTEHHAFFDASCLHEYLLNHRDIHSGRFASHGDYALQAPKRAAKTTGDFRALGEAVVLRGTLKAVASGRVPRRLAIAAQEGDFSQLRNRRVSPEELKALLLYCEELGALGEQLVLEKERKRLRTLGHHAQANATLRVSLQSVGEGYDIRSFEDDGVTPRYLEVKTTTRSGTIVDVSRGEWRAAERHRAHYYLVRVMRARKAQPEIRFIQDPVGLLERGQVTRTPAGWRLDLRQAMHA